jgi:chromate transporter
MPLLLDLFLTFFKIGLFTFGGGYAMIPIITDEVIAHSWLVESEILNFIAVAESTPGPIAINMATFVGANQGGILGAMMASLGVVLPSFIIILVVASLISGLMKFAGVNAFLKGVRPVVVGLIVSTGITMVLSVVLSLSSLSNLSVSFDWRALVIFISNAVLSIVYKKITKKGISPIILIIFSALLGMLFYGLLA